MASPIATDSPTSQKSSRKRSRSKRNRMLLPSSHGANERIFNEGSEAFWKNYQKAADWSKTQEIAYWRSRAAALEFENNMLRQHIMRLSLDDQLPPVTDFRHTQLVHNKEFTKRNNVIFNPDIKGNKYPKKVSKNPLHSGQHPDKEGERKKNKEEAECEPQLKFEVTEEMKDFFELHMRHKMEQEKKHEDEEKKRKEAAHAAGEENAKLICQPLNFAARTEELRLLYGEAAPMIHGMETAIQLTFRRHCETTGARLWPNIPLRL